MRALLLCALVALTGCARREPLPDYGKVEAFQLTDANGKPFASGVLDGKIWVADFIFTNCPGPCPRMSQLMSRLQEMTSEVQLVSFSVDPARDTPEVLAKYAKQYQAIEGRWHFLTGDLKDIHRLSRDIFKLGDVDASLNHSTRFVLIDRKGRIRGYYGTQEDAPLKRLVADIKMLAEEPS
ncbi:MAG: SCO family protein [Rhodospirillales bacterium]|nr:SCO family protein [Rhodospirillales bacterium]